MMQARVATGLLCGLLCFGAVQAEEAGPTPLPEPLDLQQALALADEAHPDLELAQARLSLAEAQAASVTASYGVELSADIRPQYVQPANPAFGPQTTDNQAHLYLTKRLYDFGHTRAGIEAANRRVSGAEFAFLDTRQQRRLEILRRFFDVLLADMRYMVDNEAMAYAYVGYDRIRERHKQGSISDVDLAASETAYREQLVRRSRAQIDQRISRQQLAIALNRPEQLSDKLVPPVLRGNDRKLPEFEDLFQRIQAANPTVSRLRKEVEAGEYSLQAAQYKHRPMLDAEIQGSYWERNIGSRDNWRATLNLHIPLYQGRKFDAEVAQVNARLRSKRAELKKAEYDLRQQVLNLLQHLELLQVERETARTRSDYRDLYLDRSRALYEMEAEVSLGDAMTRLTEAQWKAVKVEFELAITWAQLDAMSGSLVTTVAQGETSSEKGQ